MKNLLIVALTFSACVFANGAPSTATLDWTMSSDSVQAQLKEVLFEKMEADAKAGVPSNIQGDYSKVTFKEKKLTITCEERNAGGKGDVSIQVQKYRCQFIIAP